MLIDLQKKEIGNSSTIAQTKDNTYPGNTQLLAIMQVHQTFAFVVR